MTGTPSVRGFFGQGNKRALRDNRLMIIALIVALFVLLPITFAQTTSTIEGRITDSQGAAVTGADVRVSNSALAIERNATSDSTGFYRIAGLPPGVYTLTITKSGFSVQKSAGLEVTVNRTLNISPVLRVAAVASEVTIEATAPLLEPTSSSTGGTITPTQIASMPINGRDYLDLMQLIPGVAINKQEAMARSVNQNDPSSDAATPIMGERSGNAQFLIDGMPNTDQVTGGPASQFNEESILEFQVIVAGYKAEFGHGSGGVINVVSKSGTNQWHGGTSFFHRNYVLDSSNNSKTDAPFLLRWDPSVQFGGPIVKDKVFFYGSAERIRESRELNFQYPPSTPDFIITDQQQYDQHNQTYDLRLRGKLDEQVGNHRLTQQVNWTNTQVTDYLPLSMSVSMPSQRYNIDARHLILGFNDTATLGNQSDPFVFNGFYQYRGEPSRTQAAHPDAGTANTLFSMFSSLNTGGLFGDLGNVQLGYGSTPAFLDQKYSSAGLSLAKHLGRNSIKFGWDFQHMSVDGEESALLYNQLFATVADFGTYGPDSAGVSLLQTPAAQTPNDSQIRLRNIFNGLFFQDDIKLFKNLTMNAGLRWDRDSRFPTNGNFSPRIGFAWAPTPKTVIRGSYGLFYDHFRLGTARDIPGFGGANLQQRTFFSLPRLFYGNPSILLPLFAAIGYNTPCAASSLTDAQIAGAGCPFNPALPYFGIDHLNSVVAAGHAPIPAGAVVNFNNVQTLTGLTPDEFAAQAAAALGQAPGYFTWDPLGHLGADKVVGAYDVPITIDPGFKVPYTQAFQVGFQREIGSNFVVAADYYHRDMRHILGQRYTNIAFEARLTNNRALLPGTGTVPILGYGPWFDGKYDGVVISARKPMSKHFTLEGSYTWTNATDNVISYTGAGTALPSDGYVGMVPVVSQPTGTFEGKPCGGSNQNAAFTSCVGNPVPQAGQFWNGPNYDKGQSALSLNHTFLVDGLVELPWKFQFSSIFRVQSGFPYSRTTTDYIDVDGNTNTNSIDHNFGRNAFNAPVYTNMDFRVAKRFDFTERMKLHLFFEMFNLFNAANPAAVQTLPDQPDPFGSKLQVLPGREGQVGLRFEF